ncbi:MAG: DUF1893 domain-containing protein [Clostridia bacterium]|nr:DUF1893 domain-containing protein [Clostridia bacterium]
MQDLEQAKALLAQGEHTCVRVLNGEAKVSAARRLEPLIAFLKEDENTLRGAAVADRVIGAAAAWLLAYGGAARVYGGVMSAGAAIVLEQYGIAYEFGEAVAFIQRPGSEALCPMEERALTFTSAEQAYKELVQ